MGHLTRIANTVVQNLEKGHVRSQISDLIKGRFACVCRLYKAWEDYIMVFDGV